MSQWAAERPLLPRGLDRLRIGTTASLRAAARMPPSSQFIPRRVGNQDGRNGWRQRNRRPRDDEGSLLWARGHRSWGGMRSVRGLARGSATPTCASGKRGDFAVARLALPHEHGRPTYASQEPIHRAPDGRPRAYRSGEAPDIEQDANLRTAGPRAGGRKNPLDRRDSESID